MNTSSPITADSAVLFIDVQEGIINVAATTDPERLRSAVVALAQIADILDMPIVVACVPTTGGTVAPLLAELAALVPDVPVHVRSTVDIFADGAVRAAVVGTGRRALILAGVATDVAVALAATSARRSGYAVAVAVDACSALDSRTEAATFAQLTAIGVTLTSVPAIAAELCGDFSREAGRATMLALAPLMRPPAHDHDHDLDIETNHDHDHDHGHDHGNGQTPLA